MKIKTALGAIIVVLMSVALMPTSLCAQRIGFVSSDAIREKFPEATQADQRIQSIVEDWKRELAALDKQIDGLETEIKKNRLIWGDEERIQKDKDLDKLKSDRLAYSKKKFEPNGEYDQTVKTVMKPVEDKIYAAIQKVSSDEGYDIVWDKSQSPLTYVNYKYDLTVKVLRELGVDVKKLEEELNEKIAKDPRNKKSDVKTAPKSRMRDKSRGDTREIEKETPADQQAPGGQSSPADTTKPKMDNPITK